MMTSVLSPRDTTRKQLAAMYGPIQEELARVEALLVSELKNPHAFVDELTRHAFRLAGKRLRPALLLLSAKAVGDITEEHIKLAAVVEMIHAATLVHDDILDEATVRRHRETVNVRHGNEASVLLGDFLFTHAFYLASMTGSTFACRTIGRATNITCEGELRQVHAAGRLDLSESEYLAIIEAKTAELCACSCELGAHFAGGTLEAVRALASFGRHLGIAFQIIDDVLDLVGRQETVGKSLGTDLEKRKATLPIIRLLHDAAEEERAAVVEILTRNGNHRAADLSPWLARSGAVEYARDVAARHVRKAIDNLQNVPAGPIRDMLGQVAEFVLMRQR
jgi:octaprenyl-diphosphate synthase